LRPVEPISSEIAGIRMPPGDPGAVTDTAEGVQRAGHAFAACADVVGRAVGSVADWSGIASLTFRDLCRGQRSAALEARDATIQAARALHRYAHVLEAARRRVARLQEEGARQEARRDQARAAAQDAQSEADTAFRTADVVGLVPSAHAVVADLQARGRAAMSRSSDHARTASVADAALGDLRREAAAECDKAKLAASEAVCTVGAAAASLPEVRWPGQSGTGDITIHSIEYADNASVTVFFVKLANGQTAKVSEKADHTWTVEVAKTLGIGLSGTLGEKLQVGGTGTRTGVSRELSGAVMANSGAGMTFAFNTRGEAQDFLDDANDRFDDGFWTSVARSSPVVSFFMGAESPDDNRDPVETYSEGGVSAILGGTLLRGAGAQGVSAHGEIGVSEALGTRTDEQTGEVTTYHRNGATLSGSVEATALSMGASGSHSGSSVMSVTRDDSGEIVRLALSSSTDTTGSLDLKPDLTQLADLGKEVEKASVTATSGAGTHTDTTVTLNVTDANRDVVFDYLETGGLDPEATHNLIDHLDANGQIDVQVYDVRTEGTGFDVAAAGFGASGSHVETTSTLHDAWTRPPGDTVLHHLRVSR
jgi:hypothetical protein